MTNVTGPVGANITNAAQLEGYIKNLESSLTHTGDVKVQGDIRAELKKARDHLAQFSGDDFATGRVAFVPARPDAMPLGEGQPVSNEVLSQIKALYGNAGAIRGDIAHSGDVDVDAHEGALFRFPIAGDLDRVNHNVKTIFEGEDVSLQVKLAKVLKASSAGLGRAQVTLHTKLFASPIGDSRAHLMPLVQSIGRQTGGPAGRFTLPPNAAQGMQNLFAGGSLPRDINAFVQWVLRESYMQTTEDLHMYAEKVRFFNDCKKQIREELKRARQALSPMAGKEDNASLPGSFIPNGINKEFIGDTTAITTGPNKAEIVASQAALDDQKAEEERQKKIDEWNAKPAEHFGAQSSKTKRSYHGSDDYGKFDDHVDTIQAEAQSQFAHLSAEQKAALLEEIKKQGGITVHNRCYETDKSNNTYNRNYKVAPRHGEDFDTYMARVIEEAGADFKSYVHGTEGNIDLEWIQTSFTVPGYDYKDPMPPELRDTSSGMGGGAANQPWEDGKPIVKKADLEAYIKTLEEDLSSVGDDSQLANVDLQNILQKQQQTIQMMSNISKMLHDTALACIRKLG